MLLIDDYKLEYKLGSGSFADVFFTTKKNSKDVFATKRVEKAKALSDKMKNYFLNEVDILKNTNHQNIIKLYEIKNSQKNFYLIMEYCNGGTLNDIFEKYFDLNYKPFSEVYVQHILRQISCGLYYLHKSNIIHRDLKMENILFHFESIDDVKNMNILKSQLKIIDFGFAKYLNDSSIASSICGSPINMDPVILKALAFKQIGQDFGYTEKADMWSLGIMVYTMLIGKPPFIASNYKDLYLQINEGNYHIPKQLKLSKQAISIINGLLQFDTKERLSIDELVFHEFLTLDEKDFEYCDLNFIDKKTGDILLNNKEDVNKIWDNYQPTNGNVNLGKIKGNLSAKSIIDDMDNQNYTYDANKNFQAFYIDEKNNIIFTDKPHGKNNTEEKPIEPNMVSEIPISANENSNNQNVSAGNNQTIADVNSTNNINAYNPQIPLRTLKSNGIYYGVQAVNQNYYTTTTNNLNLPFTSNNQQINSGGNLPVDNKQSNAKTVTNPTEENNIIQKDMTSLNTIQTSTNDNINKNNDTKMKLSNNQIGTTNVVNTTNILFGNPSIQSNTTTPSSKNTNENKNQQINTTTNNNVSNQQVSSISSTQIISNPQKINNENSNPNRLLQLNVNANITEKNNDLVNQEISPQIINQQQNSNNHILSVQTTTQRILPLASNNNAETTKMILNTNLITTNNINTNLNNNTTTPKITTINSNLNIISTINNTNQNSNTIMSINDNSTSNKINTNPIMITGTTNYINKSPHITNQTNNQNQTVSSPGRNANNLTTRIISSFSDNKLTSYVKPPIPNQNIPSSNITSSNTTINTATNNIPNNVSNTVINPNEKSENPQTIRYIQSTSNTTKYIQNYTSKANLIQNNLQTISSGSNQLQNQPISSAHTPMNTTPIKQQGNAITSNLNGVTANLNFNNTNPNIIKSNQITDRDRVSQGTYKMINNQQNANSNPSITSLLSNSSQHNEMNKSTVKLTNYVPKTNKSYTDQSPKIIENNTNGSKDQLIKKTDSKSTNNLLSLEIQNKNDNQKEVVSSAILKRSNDENKNNNFVTNDADNQTSTNSIPTNVINQTVNKFSNNNVIPLKPNNGEYYVMAYNNANQTYKTVKTMYNEKYGEIPSTARVNDIQSEEKKTTKEISSINLKQNKNNQNNIINTNDKDENNITIRESSPAYGQKETNNSDNNPIDAKNKTSDLSVSRPTSNKLNTEVKTLNVIPLNKYENINSNIRDAKETTIDENKKSENNISNQQTLNNTHNENNLTLLNNNYSLETQNLINKYQVSANIMNSTSKNIVEATSAFLRDIDKNMEDKKVKKMEENSIKVISDMKNYFDSNLDKFMQLNLNVIENKDEEHPAYKVYSYLQDIKNKLNEAYLLTKK